MSILDDYDELMDNSEYNVLLNKLKDISLEQTPAYIQAWYDILYEYNDKVGLLKALNLYETHILKYSIRNSRYSIEKEAEIILTNGEPSYLYIAIQNDSGESFRKFKIKQWSNSVLAAILCDRVGNYFDTYINNILGEYNEYNKTAYDTNFQTLSDYLKQGIFRDNYYIKITNNPIVDKIESNYQIYYDTIKSILTYDK